MKKRFILILSLAFVLLLSSIVFAQGSGAKETVLDKLWGMLKFLFYDFAGAGEATIVTGIKFFLFVLLFAVLYGLSEVGPLHNKLSKNIRIVLSLSLSAMSTLLIPHALVVALASAYSAVFFGGMLAALIIAAVFLIFKTFHEPSVPHRFAKAIICGIFTGVVGSFSDLTKAGGEGIGFSSMGSTALKSLSAITDVAEFVTLIFFIMTLIYLIGALTSLSAPKAGDTKEKVWDWWNKPKTPEQIDASSKKDISKALSSLLVYAAKMTKKSRYYTDSYLAFHDDIRVYVDHFNNLDVALRKLKNVPANIYASIKIDRDLLRDLDAQVSVAERDYSKIMISDFLKSDKYKVGNALPRDVFVEVEISLNDRIAPVVKSLP